MRVARGIVVVCLALQLVACGERDPRARADDPYQACLDRAYAKGDLGVYDPPTLQRGFPADRGDRRGDLPYPSRLKWPQSPVDRCSDLRARGLL